MMPTVESRSGRGRSLASPRRGVEPQSQREGVSDEVVACRGELMPGLVYVAGCAHDVAVRV